VSQSTASQYVAVLSRAGRVTSTKIDRWKHYKRDDARLHQLGAYRSMDL
jgi:hypothetical protein